MALPELPDSSGSGGSAAPKAAAAERSSGSGGSAAPKAAAAEGPASGGPEAGPASGGPPDLDNALLSCYALKYLTSEVMYFQEVSEADMQQHKTRHGC